MLLSPVAPAGPTRRVVTNTAANIGNTGQAVVQSDSISLLFPPELMAEMPTIVVSCTAQMTAGTGVMYLWAQIPQNDGEVETAANTGSANVFSGRVNAGATARTRTFYIRPNALQSSRILTDDRVQVHIEARGENVDTEWEVTNIVARLVYEPLL